MTDPVSFRVLVVEDNDFVRMQIGRFLTEGGHVFIEAASADQAVEQLAAGVDVALVDVRMEPADGFEFIAAMRARGYKQPVILVTGDQNPDVLERASKMDVATVLMKPVQKDRLLAMVGRAMAQVKRTV